MTPALAGIPSVESIKENIMSFIQPVVRRFGIVGELLHLPTLLESGRETMNTLWQSLKSVWKAWTRLAHKIGNFQARVLLTLLYATLVLPFGLCVRLFSDPLRIKKRPGHWLDRAEESNDMHWAQRQ
jgi:hypothetical protein